MLLFECSPFSDIKLTETGQLLLKECCCFSFLSDSHILKQPLKDCCFIFTSLNCLKQIVEFMDVLFRYNLNLDMPTLLGFLAFFDGLFHGMNTQA